MRNVVFVAWMLLYFPLSSLSDYLMFLSRGSEVRHYSSDVEGTAAIIELGIWIIVAFKIYERPNPPRVK